VQVCYDPRNPTDFALPEEQALALTVWPKFQKTGIGLTVLGVLLILAAAAVIFGGFNPFPDA
jgi:hypothetical protein